MQMPPSGVPVIGAPILSVALAMTLIIPVTKIRISNALRKAVSYYLSFASFIIQTDMPITGIVDYLNLIILVSFLTTSKTPLLFLLDNVSPTMQMPPSEVPVIGALILSVALAMTLIISVMKI